VVCGEWIRAEAAGDGVSEPVAIVAALPHEIAELVRGRKADAAYRRRSIAVHWIGRGDSVVVAAGMGAQRVTLAVQAAMEEVREMYSLPPDDEIVLPSLLISVGLAGACGSDLRPGDVAVAREVVDTLTGERFATADTDAKYTLATTSEIASAKEKQRLFATYGAALVDMEAATVARLAAAKGIPFRAIKAISDAHDFELAALSRFADQQGQFRTAAFALHTAVRPHTWGKTIRLGRHSKAALAALTARLKLELRA
jgi:adenosylhomocysteine nucleosidase